MGRRGRAQESCACCRLWARRGPGVLCLLWGVGRAGQGPGPRSPLPSVGRGQAGRGPGVLCLLWGMSRAGPGPRGPTSSPHRQGRWPPGSVMSPSCPAGQPWAPRRAGTLRADSLPLSLGLSAGASAQGALVWPVAPGRHPWSLGTQLVMELLMAGPRGGADGAVGKRLGLEVAGWPQAGHPDCTSR